MWKFRARGLKAGDQDKREDRVKIFKISVFYIYYYLFLHLLHFVLLYSECLQTNKQDVSLLCWYLFDKEQLDSVKKECNMTIF